MKVIINKNGSPVVLGDDGAPMDPNEGFRRIKRKLGLSNRGIGAICGYHYVTPSNWSNGLNKPPAKVLLALGQGLDKLNESRADYLEWVNSHLRDCGFPINRKRGRPKQTTKVSH